MLDEKEQEKPQEEEESYSFLQETIKPKKISRKMLIQQFVRIALYGLIFGGVASLGFFAVKPAAQRWLKGKPETVTIPEDDTPSGQEDAAAGNQNDPVDQTLSKENYEEILKSMYQAAEERYQKMDYVYCGKSGLKLPEVSLGFWHNFGDTGVYENMKQICFTAFDNGITHFDLANNYGPEPGSAEKNFGRILKEEMGQHRDEMVISTKAGYLMWDGPYGDWGSRKYLLASLDQSLQRMGLDYVDIFYHHRMDPNTPLEETMGALATAVQSGKALYVGLSNYDGPTMEKAAAILKDLHCPFIINQNRYSIFDRTIEKNGLKEKAAELKKGIIAYSPLAQGLLTNRYLNGIPEDSRIMTDGRFLKKDALTEEKLMKIRALNEVAAGRGQTLAEMALSWILRDGIVTSVLVGASKPQQLLDNIKAIENTEFSEKELKKIDELSL